MKHSQLVKHVGVILIGLVFTLICVEVIRFFNPGVLSHVEQRLIKIVALVAGIFLLLICSNEAVLLAIKNLSEKEGHHERNAWYVRVLHYVFSNGAGLASKYLTLANIFTLGCISIILLIFYQKFVPLTWLRFFFPSVVILSLLIFLENRPAVSKN